MKTNFDFIYLNYAKEEYDYNIIVYYYIFKIIYLNIYYIHF